jgi:hypothetical protein
MDWEDSPPLYWADGDGLATSEADDREFAVETVILLEVPFEDDVLCRTSGFSPEGMFTPIGRAFTSAAAALFAPQPLSTLNDDGVRFVAGMFDDNATTVDDTVEAALALGLTR